MIWSDDPRIILVVGCETWWAMIGPLPNETSQAVTSTFCIIGHAFPPVHASSRGKREPSAAALFGRDGPLARRRWT